VRASIFNKILKKKIMKKILFLCDGDNFPKGAFQFIKQMNLTERVFIKGIFFVKFKEEEKRLVMGSKQQFADQCENSRIQYHILEKNQGWDKQIFTIESRFADLVVISEELFCSDLLNEQPNFFMQEALHEAECPVLVVPEKFERPDRIAIAYDGIYKK
jgi:hypothetical protein